MLDAKQRATLLRKTQSLKDCLEGNMPPFVAAMWVQSLRVALYAIAPDDIARVESEWFAERARVSHGLCHHCGENAISNKVTYLPFCEMCDAKMDTQVREAERELGEDWPDTLD